MSSGTGGSSEGSVSVPDQADGEGEVTSVPVLDQADEEGEVKVKKESQDDPVVPDSDLATIGVSYQVEQRPWTAGKYHVQRNYSAVGELDLQGRPESGYLSVALGDTIEVLTDCCYEGHRGNMHYWYVWCKKDHEHGYVPTSVLGPILFSLVESDDDADDGHASSHSLDDFGTEVL